MISLPFCLFLVAQVGAIRLPKETAGTAMNFISHDTSTAIDENACADLSASAKNVKESLVGKFKISLCKFTGLQGAFRIQKLKGCDGAKVEISKDPKTDAAARMLGEDEFTLELEGPEVRVLHHTSPKEDVAKCMYNVPFEVSVPGKYHVNLAFHRENFEAVKEIGTKEWPQNHLDKPLGDEIFIEMAADSTAVAFSKALNPQNLPKCDLHQENKGRWVFKENPDSIFTDQPQARCFTKDTAGVNPHTQDCPAEFTLKPAVDYRKYTWRHDQCQQKQYTPEEAGKCMKKKTLDIRGDSNMRKLYLAFVRFACGITNQTKLHEFKLEGCTAYPTCKAVCHQPDMLGQGPGALDKDLTVGNFGQWPAAGAYRKTIVGYSSMVDAYANKVEAKGGKAKFAWMESNLVPLRNDEYPKIKHDFRTGHRLKLYNDYANEKFTSMGVPIVRSFDRVTAFSQHTADNAHYPAEVNQPMVNDILNLICEE